VSGSLPLAGRDQTSTGDQRRRAPTRSVGRSAVVNRAASGEGVNLPASHPHLIPGRLMYRDKRHAASHAHGPTNRPKPKSAFGDCS
jgi:hypothetical protein